MSELGRIRGILAEHRGKTFVRRIESPKEYPKLPLGSGREGTHLMSWSDHPGGGYMVYPEIIFDHRSGQLIRLSRPSARTHALATGNYIPFRNKAEANWFSEAYKKVWR